jgi:Undecaprenyl-phosphate galactose phosphotransferase WbaP
MSATPAADLTPSIRLSRAESIRSLTYLAIIAADLAAFCLSWLVSILVRYEFAEKYGPITYVEFLPNLAIFASVFVLSGLYPGVALNPIEEFRRILRSACLGILVTIGLTFFLHEGLFVSRFIFLIGWFFTLIFIFLGRHVVRNWCSQQSWWGIPTVILGEQGPARATLSLLRLNPPLGLKPVAILYDSDGTNRDYARGSGCERGVFSGDLSHSARIALEYPGCYAILSMPSGSSTHLRSVLHDNATYFRRILVIPELLGTTSLLVTAKDICGVLALEVNQQLTRLIPQIVKRTFDVFLCLVVGILVSPLVLLIYIATRLSSRGPVFYGHSRIGRGGRIFKVWKFRSMVLNADEVLEKHLLSDISLRTEWNTYQKLRNDPRVTMVGRFLRKTSLDELPQLWNVLRGEMSLVGPRPIVHSEIEKYGEKFRQYCRVTPGITGLWQISGRNNTTYEIRTQLDDYYVRNWSVTVDLYILLHTLKTVLLTEGAY